MEPGPGFRCDVPSAELLERLAAGPLPLGLRAGPAVRGFHRDVYFDTPDGTLQRRGLTCRLRYRADDRRVLTVTLRSRAEGGLVVPAQFYEGEVSELEPAAAFAGESEPARRLRAFADPARLAPVAECEIERRVRVARGGWLSRPRFELSYDAVTVAFGELSQTFWELEIRRLRAGGPRLETLAQALLDVYGVRPMLLDQLDRVLQVRRALEADALASEVRAGRAVALFVLDGDRVAVLAQGGTLRLPIADGAGEEACRRLLRQLFGTATAQLEILGTAPAAGARPAVEAWAVRGVRATGGEDAPQWVPLEEVLARVGSPSVRDARTLAALAVAARSDRLAAAPPTPGRDTGPRAVRRLTLPVVVAAALDPGQPAPEQFINPELSHLEFHARVLAMAEDSRVPLLERVAFLSIFSANLDEFFVVRVGALKQAVAEKKKEPSPDGLTPAEQLDAIAVRARQLVERQGRCLRDCLAALAAAGIRLRRWEDLGEAERAPLGRLFDEQVFPLLTPRAMTLSPGHPFPHIRNLALSLAVMVRDPRTGPYHFVHLRVPPAVQRVLEVPGDGGFVLLEDVIRANLAPVYPGRTVETVHAFRVTRSGDLQVDEQGAGNLLEAIEDEVQRRPFQAAVRLEIERAMPQALRDLLVRELRLELENRESPLGPGDVYEADGPLDLAPLRQLAEVPRPDLRYPPFRGQAPLPVDRSVFAVLAERDLLVYHPYDDFTASVERFLEEAADDPAVQSIKLTLYRAGGRSAIVDALLRAAAGGKEVAVFVEVKARYDEQRNIEWARTLERGGIHVVYGLVDIKTHAKVLLVARREGAAVRRYVHIGTGNYNAASAAAYTDLGLFTADAEITADVGDLFNELTGSTRPPRGEYRRILVAPTWMLSRFLALIEREAEHARAGRGGRIRVKVNGLADAEIIAALYRASQAGVEIDLIVRGVCCLRPGVPGLSERIRVISLLGRFLEHARIYAFDNGGSPEHYIGSADWRPRNLRRRVEVVALVADPACRARLEAILAEQLAAPHAWRLAPDGTYTREAGVDAPR